MTNIKQDVVCAKERYIKPSIKGLDIEQEQMLLADSPTQIDTDQGVLTGTIISVLNW